MENVKIEKVGFGGIWIAHTEDGKTILVSGWVLPNMVVDVKILRKKSDFIKAQAIKVKSEEWLTNSEDVLKQLKEWKNEIQINNTKVCKHNFIFDTDIFKSKFSNLSSQSSKNLQISTGCGGCKWQILPYDKQLKLKEQVVKDSFAWVDFFSDVYEWIIACNKVFNYRNKMEFSFGKYISKEERYSDWSLGFHKQWQFSKIVDIDSCLIAGEKINEIFAYLKEMIKKSWLPVYDQFNHSWFLRHLVIREWSNTGQILVNLVIASKYLDENKKDITKWQKLQEQFMQDKFLKENITTFIITENNGLADVVKWPDIKSTPLWWPGYIYEKLYFNTDLEWWNQKNNEKITKSQNNKITDLNKEKQINNTSPKSSTNPQISVTFRVSAFSFFQTNTHQAQVLFQTAKDMLPNIKWNVLDLYCGAWTIWISLLKIWVWENLVWVEIVEDAVKDAYKNAEINWVKNRAKFIADKAENINFEAENIWVVVIDPPRSGLHPKVVEFLIDLKNKYNFPLLYISCNPVTMARDLKMLTEWWYNCTNLKAVDMFPHTHHIEMIGLLK